jgi:hypothetical protein
MSEVITKYRLLRDLPMYPTGTVVEHRYEVLPSQYLDKQGNKQNYATEGNWYTEDSVVATQFLEHLVKWCAASQREDTKGWIEKVASDE